MTSTPRLRTPAALAALAALSLAAGTGGAAEKDGPPIVGDPSQVAMTVQPSETLIVKGGTSKELTLTNSGRVTASYNMSVGNFDINPDGSVLIDPPLTPSRSAKRWLRVQPERVTLKVGESRSIRVRAVPSRFASPGDHNAIVLFVTDPAKQGNLRFRGRIGVPLLVRVDGALVRKLRVGRVTVAKRGRNRIVQVRVSNLGNVGERFTRRRQVIEVRRGTRLVARLKTTTRLLLPGTTGLIVARYGGKVRGPVSVRVTLTPASPTDAGPGIASTPAPIVRTTRVRF